LDRIMTCLIMEHNLFGKKPVLTFPAHAREAIKLFRCDVFFTRTALR
jgi:hypothetical protein